MFYKIRDVAAKIQAAQGDIKLVLPYGNWLSKDVHGRLKPSSHLPLYQGDSSSRYQGCLTTFIDASAPMWLFAFDYLNTKVYVEAGSSRPINWEDVKGKLDAAPSNKADHKDSIGGGWVSAVISDSSLIATFLVVSSIGN
ncbi:hypothetical protein KSS87_021749 [Heliosperma pusillum]|nr:hypothetical protein KSS87_021749 [Heliosperma pusillum]